MAKKSFFKITIKKVTTAKAKLTFVKVPDSLSNLKVEDNHIVGLIQTKEGHENWQSPKIKTSDKELSFVGYSHRLTNEQVETLFSSWSEFYRICSNREIYYNYSAWTGKWAVLKENI